MSIQKTTTELETLKINYLTQEMYEDALENDEINSNELYMIPDEGTDYLPLTGGTVSGNTTFENSVSIDEATVGDIVVTGNISATNNIQANTINGVTVGSSPKFTDTITTATTTGGGNAVTAVTASNGALTVTKGTTFQTNIIKTSASITVAHWNSGTTATISVSGVTASNTVIVSPAPASITDWTGNGVYCSAQASGTLTFTCTKTPTAAITVNVVVMN